MIYHKNTRVHVETFHPKTIEIENVFHIKVTKNLRVEAAANKTRSKDRKAFEYPSYLFTDIDTACP